MEIEFKKYQKKDFNTLVKCMENLQDLIVSLDPLKRQRRLQNYGKSYTNNLIKKINKQNGIIFFACDEENIVGCIAGIIEKQNKAELFGCVPTKAGRVQELFVLEVYRGKRIGKKLMKLIEDYFRKKKCDVVIVDAFGPNKPAHNFYKKFNYSDRVIGLIKIL